MTANAQTMTELFADADRLRHEESMHMAQQQYPAQAASTVIQQQMLASQKTGKKTGLRNPKRPCLFVQ